MSSVLLFKLILALAMDNICTLEAENGFLAHTFDGEDLGLKIQKIFSGIMSFYLLAFIV